MEPYDLRTLGCTSHSLPAHRSFWLPATPVHHVGITSTTETDVHHRGDRESAAMANYSLKVLGLQINVKVIVIGLCPAIYLRLRVPQACYVYVNSQQAAGLPCYDDCE